MANGIGQDQFDKLSAAMREKFGGEEAPTSEAAPVEETPVEEPQEAQEASAQEQPQEAPQEEAPAAEPSEQPEEEGTPTFTFGEAAEPAAEDVGTLKEQIELLQKQKEELEQQEVFANEQMKALNEYVRSGGEINESFWKVQNLDVDTNFSDDNSMLSTLKNKYTLIDGLTESEADRMLRRKYPNIYDKEGADEEDVLDDRINLKAAAKGELPKLKEFKQKSTLPQVDAQAIERQQQALKEYQLEASRAVNSIDKFDFHLTEDFPIQVNIDKDSRALISDLVVNPENQQNYFVNEYAKDGKVDFNKFAKDQFIKLHFEKLLQTAYAQGESAGVKKTVQQELRQENPKGEPRKAANANAGGEGWKAAFREKAARLTM